MLVDLGYGLYYGFPPCCVLRFVLGTGEQAARRGVVDPDGNAFVPCGLLHHADG